jgi:hypothetical protein
MYQLLEGNGVVFLIGRSFLVGTFLLHELHQLLLHLLQNEELGLLQWIQFQYEG